MRRRRIAASSPRAPGKGTPGGGRKSPARKGTHVIESGLPFSQSVLWACQRRYFQEAGVDAWRRNVLPHQITSNALIARSYAQLVVAWLRDLRAAGGLTGAAGPVRIIEVGAGCGQFTFHFLREFTDVLQGSSVAGTTFRYVATDCFPGTVSHLKGHPGLRPWVDKGRLEFAFFDAERDDRLGLEASGATLGPGSMRGPCVVIANYLFDSIAVDVFRAGEGRLEEGLLTLASPQAEADPTDPALISRAQVAYEFREVAGSYYSEGPFNRLLKEYAKESPVRVFPFPTGALRCVERLRAIAPGRMLLVSADKGYHRPQDVGRFGPPYFTAHGSFSISVNFHALGRAWERQGARFLGPTFASTGIDICAAVFGSGACRETLAAFRQFIELQGPDDLFALCTAAAPTEPTVQLDAILRYLRFTRWDTSRAFRCMRMLIDRAAGASRREQAELALAVDQIWAHYFHLQGGRDLPHALALICARMGRQSEAMAFLRRSLDLFGPSGRTLRLIAICAYEAGDKAGALDAVRRWRKLEPDSPEARGLDRGLTREVGAPPALRP